MAFENLYALLYAPWSTPASPLWYDTKFDSTCSRLVFCQLKMPSTLLLWVMLFSWNPHEPSDFSGHSKPLASRLPCTPTAAELRMVTLIPWPSSKPAMR